MDFDKVKIELKEKFETEEEAADVIVEIFGGSISKEEVLKEDTFLFETTESAKEIMEIFDIKDYKEIDINGRNIISMSNIKEAATIYYVLHQLNISSGNDRGICAWCKKPISIFRDKLSETEYKVSGQCQLCQDKTWEL